MTGAIDTVLARLPEASKTGPDRWRAACPVCGGRNRSTLSVGVGETGAVLLHCFKTECSAGQIVSALGLELHDLYPPRAEPGGGSPPLRRRRMLTDRQALDMLHDEAHLVAVCASNIANGVAIADRDRQRLLRAAGRVAYLRDEVMS